MITHISLQARYNFFRSDDCFDVPSHIPYAFVVSVENKIHIVNIAYVDYNKVYEYYEVKIFKNTPLKNLKQGGALPVRQHWITL